MWWEIKSYVVPIAAILALLRVYIGATVEPEPMTWLDAYKDMAHIFMGFLLALAIYDKEKSRNWWSVFWGLCLLEVMVAVLSRVML